MSRYSNKCANCGIEEEYVFDTFIEGLCERCALIMNEASRREISDWDQGHMYTDELEDLWNY